MTGKIKLKRSDLEKLTPTELHALGKKLQKVEEAARYQTLDRYLESAHPGQITFHKTNKRWRMVFSGNRWGKSTAGSVEMLWYMTGRHPFKKVKLPLKGLLVATDFENHVKNTLEPKLLTWAPAGTITKIERNQQGAMRKVYFSTGSTLDVLSQDQDIKVFESSDYDVAWFDEPCKKQIFNAVWRGLTDRGGVAYLTGTPITEPWLYNEFKKAQEEPDGYRWAMFGKTDDNAVNIGEGDPELGRKRIQEMADQYEPEERAARLEGQFLQMHGLVFKSWDRSHHLIEPFAWPAHWPIVESIDPHPRKPWAVSWIGFAENGSKVLLRCGLYDGDTVEVGEQINYERAQLNIEFGKKPRLIKTLIDNYASAPLMSKSYTDPTASRKSIREELEAIIGPRAGGPSVDVAPKNVTQKIDMLKKWLRVKETENGPRAEFYVFNTTENEQFIWEIENYVWDSKRGSIRNGLKDQPKKENDDVIDTVMQVALTTLRLTTTFEPIRTIKDYRVYRYSGGRANARRY